MQDYTQVYVIDTHVIGSYDSIYNYLVKNESHLTYDNNDTEPII